MIFHIARIACVCILLSIGIATDGDADEKKAGVIAAERWLAIIDEGKYAKSWEEAAEYFKNAVKQEQWIKSLNGVRKPLGKLILRKLKSKVYMTSLSGAPDGQYVVIQFESSFENKKTAIETVTPMLEKDGNWRVSGYYIK
jgi:hypothetical protein